MLIVPDLWDFAFNNRTDELKNIFRLGCWNIGIVAAGVLIAELVFGNWYGNDELKYLYIIRNGSWQYEVSYPGIAEDERTVIYTRDRWGLRGTYGKPENIDILTVGGSTTDQRYITEGATWQDVLAENFRRNGRDVLVANAGIDGRTTFGHQYDFDLWFPKIDRLRPPYVMLYVGLNDMFFDRPNYHFDSAFAYDASLKEQIKRDSAVYFVYRTLVGVYLAKKRNLAYVAIDYDNAEWTDAPLLSNYQESLTDRLARYEGRLREILQKINNWGTSPIIVTQPRGTTASSMGRYWVLPEHTLESLND